MSNTVLSPRLQDLLVCLVVGDDKLGACQMAMAGPEGALKELGPK